MAQVITVVLIILLIISSAGIFFAALLQPINKLSPEFECKQLQIESSPNIKKVCYNPMQGNDEDQIEITLERKFDNLQIDKINFFASNGQERQEWAAGEDECEECTILGSGETKTYYLRQLQRTNYNKIIIYANGCALETKTIKPC